MFSVDHLNRLRSAELEAVLRLLPHRARILEIGAGTGRQTLDLRSCGFEVEPIEIANSPYSSERLCEITNYDGLHIPFGDAEFDVVFSSNVLEHVRDLSLLHAEIRRVLRRDGFAVHVVPTHWWRLWTCATAFPTALQNVVRLLLPRFNPANAESKRLAVVWLRVARHLAAPFFQRRHGERGNVLSEIWLFHPSWWRKNFADNGFDVEHEEPAGVFYTANLTMGERWPIERRKALARRLGSACQIFVVRQSRAAAIAGRDAPREFPDPARLR
jgi:SAM-dependent methyltransferase